MPAAVRLETGPDRVLTVWFDLPDKTVNTLTTRTWSDLDTVLDEVEAAGAAGVVFASGKPRSFLAGADLYEMEAMDDAQLDAYLAKGQRIVDRIAALPMPTVAAINGDALGGGFELALACRSRVAVDEPRIRIGLPETTLGLVPAWGGAIRLPRLIGLAESLKVLIPGRSLSPAESLELGLIDEVVPHERLLEAARNRLDSTPNRAAGPTPAPARPTDPSAADEAARDAVLAKARADVRARSGDNLPAPLVLIDIVAASYREPPPAVAAAERRGLLELRRSPAGRNLRRLFFLRHDAGKTAAREAGGTARAIRSAVVVGGGTMGAGIAHALVRSGLSVGVIEADERSATAATARLAALIGDDSVRATTDWAPVAAADLVIEAVIEQLPAKLAVFHRLDELSGADAILASNTSSLSIREIAAATRHPGRVVGLHFFNPVPKMPLVEIVRTPQSLPDVLATCVAAVKKAEKTPVLVNDAPGFVVNRVLFPYLREAVVLLEEGGSITAIDAAIKAWGMPMGPFALMDEIGLDVTRMILESLGRSLGNRLSSPPILDRFLERDWLGRKSGSGFYTYPTSGRPVPNPDLPTVTSASPSIQPGADEVQDRLMRPMAAEARLVLAEKVVESPESLDLATVLGIGFAPFRGGLASFAGLDSKPTR
jgi:3-hydroxyacyl-CoA dehydrogenase/enoyl-CoA hydratase/carnithine racemase